MIEDFTGGMEFGDYRRDLRTQWAVERGFSILAEALNQISSSSPEVAARIPDLVQIIGFRNRLIHVYHRVDPVTVWDCIVDDLPPLRLSIESLLDELDQSRAPGPEAPTVKTEPKTGSRRRKPRKSARHSTCDGG